MFPALNKRWLLILIEHNVIVIIRPARWGNYLMRLPHRWSSCLLDLGRLDSWSLWRRRTTTSSPLDCIPIDLVRLDFYVLCNWLLISNQILRFDFDPWRIDNMNCLRLALNTLPDSHIIIRSRQHTDIFGCLSRHHLLLHYLELLLKLLAL